MTRGKKPDAAIAEAKGFAERMGYRWIENPHKDLPYDLQIFHCRQVNFENIDIHQILVANCTQSPLPNLK